MTSPTFTLGQRYRGGRLPVSHLDLYRLASLEGEDPALLEDYLDPQGVAFVEWPAVGAERLGRPALEIRLAHAGGERRSIELRSPSRLRRSNGGSRVLIGGNATCSIGPCTDPGAPEGDPRREGRMKASKALIAALALTAILASAVPAAAQAPARAQHPPFRHYVACGVQRNSKPAHECPKRSRKGAFFRSLNTDVFYAVCVKFPSGKHLCAHAQPAKKGTLYVNRITSTQVGKHVVTWFVKGKRVGMTIFRVKG